MKFLKIPSLVALACFSVWCYTAQAQDEQAVETNPTVGERVDAAIDATKKNASKATDYVTEKSATAWEGAKTGAGKAKEIAVEKSAEAWEATKSGTKKAVDYTTEKSGEAWDATKKKAVEVKEVILDTVNAEGEAPVEERTVNE